MQELVSCRASCTMTAWCYVRASQGACEADEGKKKGGQDGLQLQGTAGATGRLVGGQDQWQQTKKRICELGLGKGERGRLLHGAWEDRVCRQVGNNVGDQGKKGAIGVATDQNTCS